MQINKWRGFRAGRTADRSLYCRNAAQLLQVEKRRRPSINRRAGALLKPGGLGWSRTCPVGAGHSAKCGTLLNRQKTLRSHVLRSAILSWRVNPLPGFCGCRSLRAFGPKQYQREFCARPNKSGLRSGDRFADAQGNSSDKTPLRRGVCSLCTRPDAHCGAMDE